MTPLNGRNLGGRTRSVNAKPRERLAVAAAAAVDSAAAAGGAIRAAVVGRWRSRRSRGGGLVIRQPEELRKPGPGPVFYWNRISGNAEWQGARAVRLAGDCLGETLSGCGCCWF